MRTPVKKGDFIIIAIVAAAALAGFAFTAINAAGLSNSPDMIYAQIYENGALSRTIPLSEGPLEIRLKNELGYNLLMIDSNSVAILESDCHSQDCVRAGIKSRPGEILICMPHRLMVRLTSEKAGELDAITG